MVRASDAPTDIIDDVHISVDKTKTTGLISVAVLEMILFGE